MLNTEGLCLGCMNDNGGERVCPICGYDNSAENPKNTLPVKSIIANRYLIGKALTSDGEGITYIGWDNAKSSRVKIKEYFPKGFATRNADKTVSIPDDGRYTFNEGLLEFIDINRSIMISTLPALMPVYDVFEDNGTAYCITEFISGITLEEFLKKNGGSLKWEQARPLFLPVIDTVGSMNDIGYIHGGISAQTVIVGRDGKLRISDYSVKKLRRADSELDSCVYDGYAAYEQYGSQEFKNDTYTDVYGLCAVLFRVLIGAEPPVATQRITNDVMTIPAHFAEELPRQVLAALANGLQVLPNKRTKNIDTFKNEFVYGEIDSPAPEPQKAPKPQSEDKIYSNSKDKPKKKASSAKYAIISSLCTVFIIGIIAVALIFTVFKDSVFPPEEDVSSNNIVSVISEVSDNEAESIPETVVKKFTVPDFSGKYYSEIEDNEDYNMFKFVLKQKTYSDEYPRGTVCKQSVKVGSSVERDTEITLTISLGPKEIKMPNLKGLSENDAKLELLKQGFLYENIKVLEKYDEESEPESVLDQSPKYGESLSTETVVEIYINSYEGDPEEGLEGNDTQDTDLSSDGSTAYGGTY